MPVIFFCSKAKWHWPHLVALGISGQLPSGWPKKTSCVTLDPINALHSGQGFFLQNLVAIEHLWSIWPVVDPGWPLHDIWPQQYITLWSSVLPTKFSGFRAFLRNWPLVEPGWPMYDLWPPWMHYTSVKGTNLVAIGHSWAFWPLVDPYVTFDPSNVLHSNQGFFSPNLVVIWHS